MAELSKGCAEGYHDACLYQIGTKPRTAAGWAAGGRCDCGCHAGSGTVEARLRPKNDPPTSSVGAKLRPRRNPPLQGGTAARIEHAEVTQ